MLRKGRTSLFNALMLTYRKAMKEQAAQWPELLPETGTAMVSRKEFISNVAMAGTAMALSGVLESCTGHQQNHSGMNGENAEVAVIGAGMAGLHAAYVLKKSGINAKVFEASNRAGGRIYTVDNVLADGISTEFGGEFIDSGHEDMRNLIKEFGLETLDYIKDYEDNNLIKDTYFLGGRHYTEAEVITEFRKIIPEIKKDISRCPERTGYRNPEPKDIDNMSIADYLKKVGAKGWFFDLLYCAYTAEFGLDASEQSGFNFLGQIGLETKDGFRMYGDSDERFKIAGGNSKLTEKLSDALKGQIHTQHYLTSLVHDKGSYTLSFKNGVAVKASHVIVTIPFTILRNIELVAEISPVKRKAINELGYGTNSKLLLGFNERIWRLQGHRGYVYNEKLQNGWDSSQMQNGNKGPGGFTVFVGGKSGTDINNSDVTGYANGLENIFPGSKRSMNGKTAIFKWPEFAYSKGSYACYKKGQWTTISGSEGEPEGNIYFAGEHCSYQFQGFMNGAAETGRLAAEEIIKRVYAVKGKGA